MQPHQQRSASRDLHTQTHFSLSQNRGELPWEELPCQDMEANPSSKIRGSEGHPLILPTVGIPELRER